MNKKTILKPITAILLAFVMLLTGVIPGTLATAKAAENEYYLKYEYVDADGTVKESDPIKNNGAVEIKQGTKGYFCVYKNDQKVEYEDADWGRPVMVDKQGKAYIDYDFVQTTNAYITAWDTEDTDGYISVYFTIKIVVDTTDLDAAIANAEKLSQSNYSTEGWANLTNAVATAKSWKDKIATDQGKKYQVAKNEVKQQNIDDATVALNTAILNLKKEDLQKAITEADAVVNDNYTEETWTAFQNAVNDMKALQTKEDVTAEEIGTAVETVATAKNALQKKAADQTKIADGTVYFQYSNGQIQYMDETNAFTLKNTDKGTFKVAGASGAEWDCSTKEQMETPDHTISTKTHYWIKYMTGEFDGTPGARSGLKASVDTNGKNIRFTLNVVEEAYVELKAYIGDTELTTENPYAVNVADKNSVTFKARKEGETDFSWISPDLLDVHEKDANYGRYDRVNRVFIVLRDDADAEFTVNLKSNEKVKVNFSLTAKKVAMKDFHVSVPSVAYIDAWNTLSGNQYVGTSYSVSYTPSNTSNRDLQWENLTPDIAEYSDEVFSNGIVPKKAGIARFMVSSKQNPEIKHEVTMEFKYRYPLQKASVEKDTFNIEVGTRQSLTINATPSNATEQRFDWKYSKDGIVKVTDEINGSITDPTAKTTIHTIRAIKSGTVTVTGTPVDGTADCEPVIFTVNVTKNGSIVESVDIDKIVSDGIASAVRYMNEAQKTYEYDNEWAVITKYRTGQTLDEKTLNHYYNSVAAQVSKWKSTQKPTDIARVSLALSAIGADITNVKGVNLAEMMYNSPLLQTGSNELIWCLLALDATNIEIPANARWSRQKMVDALLSFQNENGGYGLYNNKTYDVDLTGMAFQALAPYAKQEKVQESIEKSLEFLQDKLSGDYGYETSETCSQVILGLSALKLNPLENGFGTESKNIFSYFQTKFAVPEGGFRHKEGQDVNYMGTYQALEALEGYRRYAAGEASFWDMKDVKKFVPDDNNKLPSTPADETTGEKPDTEPDGTTGEKPDTEPDGTTGEKPNTKPAATTGEKPNTKPAATTGEKPNTKPAATTGTKSNTKPVKKKYKTKISKPGRVSIKKAKRSGRKIKIQWKKVKGCKGYQICISNKKNGKYKLVKTRKGVNAINYTLKQQKKKKVFIKVRAYKAVGKRKVYGKYSKVKTVR